MTVAIDATALIESTRDTIDRAKYFRPAPVTLPEARIVFRRWLGDCFDTGSLDAMLCALAVERLEGDPLWLLLVSGSGNAKTETVQAARGAGAVVISTLASEGALLSGTSAKDRGKGATGGLLRLLGDHGVLVIKDFTTIISAHRDTRAMLLAAFREIHDGYWSRNVGSDGGRSLEWTGRLAVIGAVTTAWDRAHDVIAAMGDRFVLVRMDSTQGRTAAGLRAMGNVGIEERMREELAAAVAGVIANMNPAADLTLSEAETQTLLAAANLVTLARTGVDYDYRGDVIDAHAPEMPTRFAKQLTQIVRGGLALGMTRAEALGLAIRCARDSVPPLRLAILLDVTENPASKTRDVRTRLGKPRATVDRQLQSLHMLGLLTCREEEDQYGIAWRYTVAPSIDPAALSIPQTLPDLSLHGDMGI